MAAQIIADKFDKIDETVQFMLETLKTFISKVDRLENELAKYQLGVEYKISPDKVEQLVQSVIINVISEFAKAQESALVASRDPEISNGLHDTSEKVTVNNTRTKRAKSTAKKV